MTTFLKTFEGVWRLSLKEAPSSNYAQVRKYKSGVGGLRVRSKTLISGKKISNFIHFINVLLPPFCVDSFSFPVTPLGISTHPRILEKENKLKKNN